MNSIHPLQLHRFDMAAILAHQDQLLQLTANQIQAAQNILKEDVFPFRQELLTTMEKGWLDQESWHPNHS